MLWMKWQRCGGGGGTVWQHVIEGGAKILLQIFIGANNKKTAKILRGAIITLLRANIDINFLLQRFFFLFLSAHAANRYFANCFIRPHTRQMEITWNGSDGGGAAHKRPIEHMTSRLMTSRLMIDGSMLLLLLLGERCIVLCRADADANIVVERGQCMLLM